MDHLLAQYLKAEGEDEAQGALESLLGEHATPIIRRTLRSKLPEVDWPDLDSQIRLQLLERLQKMRSGRAPVVDDFAGYVAVSAYRACYAWLREEKPNYTRLRNRIRYQLENDPRWLGRVGESAAPLPCDFAFEAAAHLPERELLRHILTTVQGPVTIPAVTALIARLKGVRDEGGAELSEMGAGTESSVVDRLDRANALRRLWVELRELPVNQRHAVLLALDGIEQMPACGVASVRELAAALELPLAEFAGLWSGLPLADAAIAARLRLTRQQVINLRKSARERLSRRLAPKWGTLVISAVIALLFQVGGAIS